jgi:6-phosphogluconate dehydrogenase
MVHNGIEYGLVAAYAEGFNIPRHAGVRRQKQPTDAGTTPRRDPDSYTYQLKLADIAELWRRESVVAPWLLDLPATPLLCSPELDGFTSRVSDSGEGRWTVTAAIDESVPAPVLSTALYARFSSCGQDDFADKLLSAMCSEFGGHQERQPTRGAA